MIGLTDRQLAVLRYIGECALTGLPPSYREIGEHFGFANTNASADHIRALVRKGMLRPREADDHGRSRALALTDLGWETADLRHAPPGGFIHRGRAYRPVPFHQLAPVWLEAFVGRVAGVSV